MLFYKRVLLAVGCLWSCLLCRGATLTFVEQPASAGGDNSWFNAVNWFIPDNSGNLLPAGRVPQVDEGAIITGSVDLQAGGVRVATLVATNNASITNGTVAVENLQLLSGSSFTAATINVLTSLSVAGTNCALNGATLNVLGIASGFLQAASAPNGSSLLLNQGSVLSLGGGLNLGSGSQIIAGGAPQNKIIVQTTGALICTNSASVIGSPSLHLLIDNSGLIRADSGSLVFTNGIDWQSSAGTGEFRAAGIGSILLFNDPFHVDTNVTSLFTGVGTNKWLNGATIDGIVQVSTLDPATQLAGPGTLEINGSVSGAGTLHILGTTNQGGIGVWDAGTLSLPAISIDAGGSFLIGLARSACELAGCAATNFGQSVFAGGNLAFSHGAVFNNQPAAIFLMQTNGTFSSGPQGGAFNNFGLVRKMGLGTTAFANSNSIAGPDFNNSGLMDVEGGQINLLGGASSGEFRAASGASIWLDRK